MGHWSLQAHLYTVCPWFVKIKIEAVTAENGSNVILALATVAFGCDVNIKLLL